MFPSKSYLSSALARSWNPLTVTLFLSQDKDLQQNKHSFMHVPYLYSRLHSVYVDVQAT